MPALVATLADLGKLTGYVLFVIWSPYFQTPGSCFTPPPLLCIFQTTYGDLKLLLHVLILLMESSKMNVYTCVYMINTMVYDLLFSTFIRHLNNVCCLCFDSWPPETYLELFFSLCRSDLYLMSVVTTLNKVIENLAHFLSPYLQDILANVSKPRPFPQPLFTRYTSKCK